MMNDQTVNVVQVYNNMKSNTEVIYDGNLLPGVSKLYIEADKHGNPSSITLRIDDDIFDHIFFLDAKWQDDNIKIIAASNVVTDKIARYSALAEYYLRHKLE